MCTGQSPTPSQLVLVLASELLLPETRTCFLSFFFLLGLFYYFPPPFPFLLPCHPVPRLRGKGPWKRVLGLARRAHDVRALLHAAACRLRICRLPSLARPGPVAAATAPLAGTLRCATPCCPACCSVRSARRCVAVIPWDSMRGLDAPAQTRLRVQGGSDKHKVSPPGMHACRSP